MKKNQQRGKHNEENKGLCLIIQNSNKWKRNRKKRQPTNNQLEKKRLIIKAYKYNTSYVYGNSMTKEIFALDINVNVCLRWCESIGKFFFWRRYKKNLTANERNY